MCGRLLGTDDAVELAVSVDREIDAEFGPAWQDDTDWNRHRVAEIDAEIRGERYETQGPVWALRATVEALLVEDPDILRAWGDVGCLLASAEEAVVKSGLVERVMRLGAGAPRYSEPGPSRGELLAAVRDEE
ncbi:hypothetical protein ACIHCQ_34665 [Streptomyces sp. NPDC052236]|uniref:hypothetical protein n=1 Tax=Streptomyces sp. NPDC052236 TaxID=3365686 RepID=UPI0037CFF012